MRKYYAAILAALMCLPLAAEVPELYREIGERYGLSGEMLHAFALAQSKRKSSGLEVPWPWTVRVNGQRYQFRSRIEMFNYLIKNRDKQPLFGFDNRAIMFQTREILWAELEPEAMLSRSAARLTLKGVVPTGIPVGKNIEVMPALLSPREGSFSLEHLQVPAYIHDLVTQIAREVGIDDLLIYAVMSQESGFKANALSHKGAMGLMQLMPQTAQGLGLTTEQYYDPYHNIRGGARYLKQQLQDFGSLSLALVAYNAGPAAVRKYGYTIPPYQETQKYVSIITQRYQKLGGVIK